MIYVYSFLVACCCCGVAYAMLNVRVFSRIKLLNDKSDNPGGKKSISNPVLIVLLAAVFGISFACGVSVLRRTHDVINAARMLIALLCLVGAGCVDLREKRIPNLFPICMAASGVVLLLLGFLTGQNGAKAYLVSSAISFFGCLVFFAVAAFLTKGGIGAGDIKLLSALGLLCGVYTICETVFFAMALCALLSVGLLLSKKKTIKEALPFGPFILAGFAISVLFFSF